MLVLEVRDVLGILSPVENNSLTVMVFFFFFFGLRKQNQLNFTALTFSFLLHLRDGSRFVLFR